MRRTTLAADPTVAQAQRSEPHGESGAESPVGNVIRQSRVTDPVSFTARAIRYSAPTRNSMGSD